MSHTCIMQLAELRLHTAQQFHTARHAFNEAVHIQSLATFHLRRPQDTNGRHRAAQGDGALIAIANPLT